MVLNQQSDFGKFEKDGIFVKNLDSGETGRRKQCPTIPICNKARRRNKKGRKESFLGRKWQPEIKLGRIP